MSRAAVERVAKQQWEWARKQGSPISYEQVHRRVAATARKTDAKRGRHTAGKEQA